MEDEASEFPDSAWVRRQLSITAVGTVIAVGGAVSAVIGMIEYPWQSGNATGPARLTVAGAGTVALSCLILLGCWLVASGGWRRADSGPYERLRRFALAVHVLSYVAVLVGMFGALAASALAGWDSPSGVYFGVGFLLIIFGQIAAGTQYLRSSGPAGTVPNHLRRLNRYVQSQR
jgi:cation transport ATPase